MEWLCLDRLPGSHGSPFPSCLIVQKNHLPSTLKGVDLRPLSDGAQVEVERLAHGEREVMMVKGQMQDEPNHFAPDQALLLRLGRVDADARNGVAHRAGQDYR